jgi:hypothetical protein
MEKIIKYVVIPGKVASEHDHDVHFIDAPTLMDLYKVDPKECVVLYGDDRDIGKDFRGLIQLHPHYNGNYELPSDVWSD